jgi:hypothetical protein
MLKPLCQKAIAMGTFFIRSAQPDDISALSQLWQDKVALLQQSDPYFTPLLDGRIRWTDSATDWVSRDDVGFFVAESKKQLVGYVVVTIQNAPPGLAPSRFGQGQEMVMDVHTYHGGLARALVSRVWDWLDVRDIQHLSAAVPRRFAAEQAFWLALGASRHIDIMWVQR